MAGWKEDLKKRGQAARARLVYRADHPEESKPAERPVLQYIPDTPPGPPLPTAPTSLGDPGDFLKAPKIGSFEALQQFSQAAPMPPAPAPSAKQQWYESESAARDKQLAGAPNFIKKPLEWFGHAANVVEANIPGLADFQQGAGQTLGVEADTAPKTGGVGGKIARGVGRLVAGAVNPAALEQSAVTGAGRATTGILQRYAPTLNPFAQRLAGAATEGAMQGAANTAASGRTSLGEVAEGAAFGGAGGAVFEALGTGLGKMLSRRFSSAGVPEPEKAAQELLALPLGREDAARARSFNAPGTDPIVNPYEPEPLGLPAPRVDAPTTGRIVQQQNPYRQQFEDLIAQAQRLQDEGRFTPGHEDQELEGLWASIAGRDAPSLDELIELAYKPAREIDPNLVQKARRYQAAREVAGAPMPVKPMAERTAPQGVLDEAAPIVQKVGRRPQLEYKADPEPATGGVDQEPMRAAAVDEQPLPEPQPLPKQRSAQSSGFSAFGQQAGAYDNLKTSTKSQLVTKTKKEKLPLGAIADKLYTQVADDLHPAKRFDEAVEEATGKKLDEADKAHTLGLNSRGADVIAQRILTAKQVDANGNVIGKGLKEILTQLPDTQHSYVDFEDYLVNKHAITRMESRGEKVFRDELNWTPDVGRQNLANYEAAYPQFKAMADEIYEFQQNMVQHWLVDTGMITQKAAEQWFDENPFYIPNKRFFSELEKGAAALGNRSKKGFANQNAPVKGYKPGGSERKIISPIESMIENVDAFVKAAKRNEVMQAVAKNLEKNPEALDHFAEFVPETQVADSQSVKAINTALQEDGIDGLVAKLGEDFDPSFRKATQRGLDKDNIVRVMINGEPKYIQINNKPFLEAITALGPDASNAVMDFLGKVTNGFKLLTTGVNAVFSLTRNIVRDIPAAYVNSKSTNNPVKFMADLAQSAYAIARNKELYQEFQNVGGGHSSPTAADRNLLKASKRQILPQRSKLHGALPRAFDKYQDFLNTFESAPRVSEYKRVASDGTPKARKAGLFAANDVTVNFKRRGRLTKQLDKVFPYANAAVQSLDKTARTFIDNPFQTSAKAALAVGLPAMLSYVLNHDDPAYQQVSKRTKDNFHLIPKGDGTFWKIAKPKELGTVFADIPERLLAMFADKDPHAFQDFADQVRTTFLPPGVAGAAKSGGIPDRLAGVLGDTVIGPIADVYANKDFAERPIVPAYLENLSPELQADNRTSSIAKWAGEHTGSSPKELDYLFKSYFGILAQIGQPALSPGGSIGDSLKQQVTVDPVFSNDIMTNFYNAKGKLDQARTDYGTTGDIPEDYNDNTRKYLGKVSDKIGELRKQSRTIEADKTIPAAQKREQLRAIQDQMNKYAQIGLDAVNQK